MVRLFKKFKVRKNSIEYNNLKYYVLNGILFTIVTNLYKPFAQKFLYRLNGTETHMSLFNALPGLVAVFAVLPGLYVIGRCVSKKKIMMGAFFLSRLFLLGFAFVPLMPAPMQPMMFVLLTAFMNFPDSVSNTSLQNFAADVFPEKGRATAIASRNQYSTFISFISILLLGQIISLFGVTDAKVMQIYQIFFVAAFLLSMIEIASLYNIQETNREASRNVDIWKELPGVLKNKGFMKFLLCSLLFHFGWQMGWPLFSIYQIKYLNASESWLTVLNVSSGIVMFFAYGIWEKIIRKKGNPFAITYATMGMAATPIFYALSPNLYILALSGLVMGFFTSGTVTGILNSLLEAAPEKNRIVYVGVHATMTSVTLFIAPLMGDFILGHSSIYIALWLTGAMRFIGSFAFYMRDKYNRKLVANGKTL